MKPYSPDSPLFSLHIPKCAGTSFDFVLEKWFTNKGSWWNIQNRPRIQKYLGPVIKLGIPQIFYGDRLFRHYKPQILNLKPQLYNLSFLNRITTKPICIHGHFDKYNDGINFFHIYPNANQFITIFRDPLEMQLSLFHYNKRMIHEKKLFWNGKKVTKMEYNGDVDQWLINRRLYLTDFIPFDINKENYKGIFKKYFIHIGISEDMNKSIKILADKLNMPAVVVPKLNYTIRNETPSEKAIRIFKENNELEYRLYDFALSLNK